MSIKREDVDVDIPKVIQRYYRSHGRLSYGFFFDVRKQKAVVYRDALKRKETQRQKSKPRDRKRQKRRAKEERRRFAELPALCNSLNPLCSM
jgi:hypothetical protein